MARITALVVVLVILLAFVGCATTSGPPIVLNPGDPNTITFVNDDGVEEIIYDLTGRWDGYTVSQYTGKDDASIKVEQNGNSFVGYNLLKSDEYWSKGDKIIVGKLDKHGFTKIRILDCDLGNINCQHVSASWKILDNGNKITLRVWWGKLVFERIKN